MIVVSIDVWPYGFRECQRQLALLTIRNDGTGTVESGNYEVTAVAPQEPLRSARVRGYRRSDSVLLLLQRAVNALLTEDNDDGER